MSIFYDGLDKTGNFAIGDSESNMTTIVDPVDFVISTQNISDVKRLADSLKMQGGLEGVKLTFELTYNNINLEHFKEIYDNTQKKYNNGESFFMCLKVPLYAENKTIIRKAYFMSSLQMSVSQTSEYLDDSSYKLGGSNFDCMYKNMKISFVEQ